VTGTRVEVARRVSQHPLLSAKGVHIRSVSGNLLATLRKLLPSSLISCGVVSERIIDRATSRCPGFEAYVYISDSIPLPSDSQDIVFTACVFHHIPHDEHKHWLEELRRITRPGGLLIIFEHNPYNPLTVRAVNTCPLDVNAKLITATTMSDRLLGAMWDKCTVEYKLFFPSALRKLRPLEKSLTWLPLGAQYRLAALKAV
ncbi:class I SAM-dependent methyltransferase, partial [Pseudomonas syringae]